MNKREKYFTCRAWVRKGVYKNKITVEQVWELQRLTKKKKDNRRYTFSLIKKRKDKKG